MQVYLPEPLYTRVKARGLPVSELLQKALDAELRRLELIDEADRYVRELVDEVGEPTPEEVSRAKAFAARIARRAKSPTAAPRNVKTPDRTKERATPRRRAG